MKYRNVRSSLLVVNWLMKGIFWYKEIWKKLQRTGGNVIL